MLKRMVLVLAALVVAGGCADSLRPALLRAGTSPADVRDDYFNVPVTALGEDCESVRMALGAAWDDALACRAMADYLKPWREAEMMVPRVDPHEGKGNITAAEKADMLVKRGTRLYELVKCVDHGIQSVRLARDSRDEPGLEQDIAFWRNELALAAAQVTAYADSAATLKRDLQMALNAEASKRGVSAKFVEPKPWANPQREAWRKAGPMVGIRLPLAPAEGHPAAWWNNTMDLGPLYIAAKFREAGNAFFTSEQPLGAWGLNCTGEGRYDFTNLVALVAGLKDRRCNYLLELPTLSWRQTPEQVAAQHKRHREAGHGIWSMYTPSLPAYLADDESANMIARRNDGTFGPSGQAQLFNPAVAKAYGEYLKAMSAELRRQGLYDTIAAIHLERSNHAHLSEAVDYSPFAAARWQAFMKARYGDIASLNGAAGTKYTSFDELQVPFREIIPAAKEDWDVWQSRRWPEWLKNKFGHHIGHFNEAAGTEFKAWEEIPVLPKWDADYGDWRGTLASGLAVLWDEYAKTALYNYDLQATRSWGQYVREKYKTADAIRAAFGDDCRDGYEWRLPLEYPPVIRTDYLHFRRAYVRDYLAVKRELAAAAFPDKLIIAEMRQFGDHDGVAGKGEQTWGAFLGETDDISQFSGVGAANETQPFMIRSVEPVGFGTRPSDAIESLFRDYLWINFTDPGDLARYFYVWVGHGYMDYQLGWHDIHNHWMTNRLIYSLGSTVAATAPAPQRIGLLFPRATIDLHYGPIYDEALGWDWLLGQAKLAYTRVDERLIREGWLKNSGLEVLILPAVLAMDDDVAAAIDSWVKAGGTLIASTFPGRVDAHGRSFWKKQPFVAGEPADESPLAKVLDAHVDGTISEAVKDTPLTITVPRGFYSGGFGFTTDRKPTFHTLTPGPSAKVLAIYESGKPAITLNAFGQGKAVLFGYPMGTEFVATDRTSIGFYRSYVFFAREKQQIDRVEWLKKFLREQLGFQQEFDVKFADVARFQGKESVAPGFGVPKGFSQENGDFFHVRTVGDPRGDAHEVPVMHEATDLALRFFPRQAAGDTSTRYLGISTRDVHYLTGRAAVNMHLGKHTYKCRINNPKIQAIWDVARNVPVGFAKDDAGVSFTVSLPSGHLMMLAYSETPQVELIAPAKFPGRDKDEVLARCKTLAIGGKPVTGVTILRGDEIKPWLESLNGPIPPAPNAKVDPENPAPKQTVTISYGVPENKPAADKLAALLREKFQLNVEAVEQSSRAEQINDGTDQRVHDFALPVIFIGTEWTNNDLALHGTYWNWPGMYGPHLPFTSTYAWPGEGRAVVSLTRRHALVSEEGRFNQGAFTQDVFILRPVEDRWPQARRKLHIAANANDASAAVDALIHQLTK